MLLYVGGVVTLMIFGVMITRRHEGNVVPAESSGGARAAIVSLAFFGLVAWAIHATPGLDAPADRVRATIAISAARSSTTT